MRKHIQAVLISLLFMLVSATSLLAISMHLPDQGAKAQGQASAFTAEASDPTAVYYNPAAITHLDGTQIYAGTEFIFLNTDYTTLTGAKVESDNGVGIVPQLYITGHINEKVGLGLGINSLYGLTTDYGDTGSLRYIATYSELITVNFSPVLAYQINPQLSVAAGLDVVYGKADLRRNVDFGALAGASGAMDGHSILKGDGEGVGFNVAAHYLPHEQHAFGLTYRSAIDLDLDGTLAISQIPSFVGVGSDLSGAASTEIKLPGMLRFGYAFWPVPEWKLEFNFAWLDWSRFESLSVSSENPLAPVTVTNYDYDDAFIFSLGTQYEINETWAVRCGYTYIDRALPDETFNPVVPDSDRHAITAGLGYICGKIELNLSYQAVFFEDRDIANSVGAAVGATVNGTYESIVHALSAGVTWKF